MAGAPLPPVDAVARVKAKIGALPSSTSSTFPSLFPQDRSTAIFDATKLYRSPRDALLEALSLYLPDLEIEGVAAGLHLVVRLPHGIEAAAVRRDCGRAIGRRLWDG